MRHSLRNINALVIYFSLGIYSAFPTGLKADQSTQELSLQPNILLIVADDLGYSDLGVFGGEIATPNLDHLAQQGTVFTSFHTAPTCGPTRAMLMTGIDHHRVGMGANAAAIQRLKEYQGLRGYEGFLNRDAQTIAELLKAGGYQTFMAGKWDLGAQAGTLPSDRGFDRSFALAYSGASHFSDARGTFSFEAEALYFRDGVQRKQLPQDFYSTKFYTDEMLNYIHASNDQAPYLAYVAYTAPHWPLQVSDDWLDRYAGKYAGGWVETGNARLARLKALGWIEGEETFVEPRGTKLWESLTPEEQQAESRRMEIYAAMIEYMDNEIGRLISEAEKSSGDRPLMVIFLSDNGPEGNDIAAIGDTGAWVAEHFDTSLQQMGKPNSYSWTGSGWAQVSALPLSLYKSYVSEGGIRTPAIIRYQGEVGSISTVVTVKDIPATLLEAAGIARPTEKEQYLAMEGRSLLPVMRGEMESLHAEEPLGWELYGNRALILGKWKASLIWPPEGNGQWQLFDLENDPAEKHDISAQYPEQLDQLREEWNRYRDRNGMFVFDRDLGYGRY